jgi:formylglycine-generating enzyme required for sulfatase activity/tRNA A-37 threonylcarbamoyl transferase component Bud32
MQMLREGEKIKEYKLIRQLGRGASGIVWLAERRFQFAEQPVLYALKFLIDRLNDKVEIEKVRREVNIWLDACKCPGVIGVQDVFDADNVFDGDIVSVIAMQYADGDTLRKWLEDNGGKAPSTKKAVEMISGILNAVNQLHTYPQTPIVHRDLKPENILIRGNSPHLSDFGISRVAGTSSRTQAAAGTMPYMSPEAIRNKKILQVDLWAVGVIFYEMLVGYLPFGDEEDDQVSLMYKILEENPKPLPDSVPAELSKIIEQSLEKDVTKRFQTAREMLVAINKVSSSLNIATLITNKEIKTITDSDWKEETGIHNLPKTFKNSIGMEFALIPPGEFMMGSSKEEIDEAVIDSLKYEPNTRRSWFERETPQRLVTISYPFYIGKYPVVQKEWQSLMGYNPSHFRGSEYLPVESVSWYDAQEFIRRLNGKKENNYIFRLPSEAEWEYAARAGTRSFYGLNLPLDEIGWYSGRTRNTNKKFGNSKGRTHPVGQKKPNAWGLNDMHGSVWEWCEDVYQQNYVGLSTDGSPNLTQGDLEYRVQRGGSFGLNSTSCRSAYRSQPVDIRKIRNCNGFRVVAVPKTILPDFISTKEI